MLSNSVQASEPFFLGYGNLLNSVFAQSFFKHIVYRRQGQFVFEDFAGKAGLERDTIFYDELYAQAVMRFYAEQTFHEHKGEGARLMQYIVENDPDRFKKLNISLIHQLARMFDIGLKPQMESAVSAYAESGWFHADIHDAIAGWYVQTGNWEQALIWYHRLADSKGYNEQYGVKHACTVLGKYYLEHGEKEKGRSYLWREVQYNPDDAANQIKAMKS
jgi:hypothetical protein